MAAGELPDPSLSLAAANLPTDTFDPDQEAMTQFRAGLSQRFPPGDTLALRERRKSQMGSEQPYRRADRRGSVMVTVSELWLKAWRAQQTVALIERDRSLFEQLVDVAEAGYATATGRSRQQDVIRAQLELTRLEDRLVSLREKEDVARQGLSEWIGSAADRPLTEDFAAPGAGTGTSGKAAPRLVHHPAVRALEQQIRVSETGVELARQQYRPGWSLMAQYAHREPVPRGPDRANLFTVGVTFDLPLFTGRRQDKTVAAAIEKAAAARTDRSLLLRRLAADLRSRRAELAGLEKRIHLYESRLLPRMHEQAEASLAAYNNDVGDFAEAVRARIAELNARIELVALRAKRGKVLARMDYLMLQAGDGKASRERPAGEAS